MPSVASRVGGVPGALFDGKTGVLVDIDDPDQLHRAVIELAIDRVRREQLGEAARHRAAHELNEETTVRRFGERFPRLRHR